VSTESTDTTFTVDALTNDTAYVFQVAAVVDDVDGPWSDMTDPITPKAAEPTEATPGRPSAPTNFRLTPGDRQVTVSWGVPVNDGGSPITGYIVRWSSDAGSTWIGTKELDEDQRAFVVTDLTPGTQYYFSVRATNKPRVIESEATPLILRILLMARSGDIGGEGADVGGFVSLSSTTLYVNVNGK
jgi:hypothetical protein